MVGMGEQRRESQGELLVAVGELATEQASYHATDHMADDGNHSSGLIAAVGRVVHFKLDNR